MTENSPREPGRRQVLKGAAVLGGLAVVGGGGALAWQLRSGDPPADGAATAGERSTLDELANAVVSGGPGKDGIPPIDDPRFAGIDDIDFLQDDDIVFGLVFGGEARAYPQPVLVWHEIVNDTFGDDHVAVTYCPLTGTTVGFTGTDERPDMTFGTTGNLINSNLLMYDRDTDSDWPQVLGTAISGTLKGQQLRPVPLVWTTWRAWRAEHPDSRVLTTDTGALRDYHRDPYGSYREQSGYYVDEGTIFPVEPTDDTFGSKEVVLGIRGGDSQLAIPRELVREEGTVDAEVGGVSVRAEWDGELDTARVSRAGSGEPADFMDAMWFSWYSFYPNTEVRR
ncbi:DUF3179 domain-containing (seleno)protein [Haloechinothrix aidingensis]|uniref:DUF3179 domain-containing (seleno)protein n=1 Tax=Haloechinothrix aidingensis TaxID=2752311 RepID=UPI001C6111D6